MVISVENGKSIYRCRFCNQGFFDIKECLKHRTLRPCQPSNGAVKLIVSFVNGKTIFRHPDGSIAEEFMDE